MSKRFDNKKLLYIVAILGLILVLTMIIKVPSEKATLKDKLFDIDSTQVSRIFIYPSGSEDKHIQFYRKEGKWVVQQGDIVATAQSNAVNVIFMELLNLKPSRLAAADKSKWEEYELSDSSATRVRFENKKGRQLADLMIGKFSFKQSDNPYAQYSGNNIQGISYVRLSDKKEIYAVDGFLALTFNRGFDEWRDNSFLKFNINDVTKFTFKGISEGSYSLEKKESRWFIGETMTDSLNTVNYLNKISWLNGQDFKNGFKPVSEPVYQLDIEGNNLLNIRVICYKGEEEDEYIINSSINHDVYYTSSRSGLFDEVFKSKNYFLTQKN